MRTELDLDWAQYQFKPTMQGQSLLYKVSTVFNFKKPPKVAFNLKVQKYWKIRARAEKNAGI